MKIGIDLGGSHIGVGIINNGEIIEKLEKNLTRQDRVNIEETIINEIQRMIIEILLKRNIKIEEIEMIGIAAPGTISKGKIVRAGNLGIENFEIVNKLKEKIDKPIIVRNDAKCAGLAEKYYGAMKKYDDAVFLCIGTGIGGAVIYDGKLLEAKKVPGFEFSHMIIKRDGNLCSCGKRGCFETYASMKRFKERISEEYNLNTFSGEKIRKFINENPNDSRLNYMINNYIEDLSIGISNLINIFEPEIICIGGSFAEYEEILYEPLKRKLLEGNLLFNKRDDIIIKHAQLKNDAGIIGATLI